MTPSERAHLFFGSRAVLEEFSGLLRDRGIPHEIDQLHTHGASADLLPILTAVAGGASTLLVQAMLSFLERKKGQRRVVVQTTEANGASQRFEIEAPNTPELLELLAKAREVHLEEKPPLPGK